MLDIVFFCSLDFCFSTQTVSTVVVCSIFLYLVRVFYNDKYLICTLYHLSAFGLVKRSAINILYWLSSAINKKGDSLVVYLMFILITICIKSSKLWNNKEKQEKSTSSIRVSGHIFLLLDGYFVCNPHMSLNFLKSISQPTRKRFR